jgi:ribosomal protein S18 acetylase RimI-like enzyme
MPRDFTFVYVVEKEIVGFVCGHDLDFRGYLSELIVAKTCKGKGIGKQLVGHLESALVARGCRVLIADV